VGSGLSGEARARRKKPPVADMSAQMDLLRSLSFVCLIVCLFLFFLVSTLSLADRDFSSWCCFHSCVRACVCVCVCVCVCALLVKFQLLPFEWLCV
jgi:hypothetical protein